MLVRHPGRIHPHRGGSRRLRRWTHASTRQAFATSNPKRDKDVRSKRFLDAATYPDITFAGTIRGNHADGGWVLVGNLRVRDVTSPITFHVTDFVPDAPGPASGFRATATARIDRFAAGVRARGPVAKFVDVRLAVVGCAGQLAVPAKEWGRRSVTLRLPPHARR